MKSLASATVLAETRERLLRVTPHDTALWGKMTATQMVRHLSCACEAALGERPVTRVKGLPPPVIKFLALRTGMQWPKNVQTTPELKQAIAEDAGADFDVLLEMAARWLDAVAGGGPYARTHPIFGSMTTADWLRWGYLHTDHHLRQFGR